MPQPHGGVLKTGGNPGNKGGSGRPPHIIRDNFRSILDQLGTPFIRNVLSGVVPLQERCEKCGHQPKRKVKLEAFIGDGLAAVNTLARFGIGTRDELNVISPEVRLRVEQTVATIASRAEWKSDELLEVLDGIW